MCLQTIGSQAYGGPRGPSLKVALESGAEGISLNTDEWAGSRVSAAKSGTSVCLYVCACPCVRVLNVGMVL